ncbi:heme-binding protein [Tundrisphaera lichenicola]|uniref:heme-binding protein n=1 Tax=Tundrisphaera lichenicola TaxID=2029860 RepID=UPI003EB9957E
MLRLMYCLPGVILMIPGWASSEDKVKRLEEFVIPSVQVKAADSDAPLAEGWPGGTAPGLIEVKKYPAYRSAVARGTGAALGSDNVLFFPLFRHISRSEIAMTTPVVNTYTPEMLQKPKATGDVSMEFVYRSPTQGQIGQGVGSVKVEDHPAATFVCLGVQGDLDSDRMRRGTEILKSWLDEHKSEWVEDGSTRRLGYHGPMTPRDQRLWEIQIPIKSAPLPEKPEQP